MQMQLKNNGKGTLQVSSEVCPGAVVELLLKHSKQVLALIPTAACLVQKCTILSVRVQIIFSPQTNCSGICLEIVLRPL